MSFALFLSCAAQSDSLVEGDVVADYGGLANYGAHAVVDEETAAEFRAGMNLDAGEQARDLRDVARRKAHAVAPEPMTEVMSPHGVQTRIEQQYFEIGTRCRIRLENGGDIFAHGMEETRHGWRFSMNVA